MIKTLLSLLAQRLVEKDSQDLRSYLNDSKRIKVQGVIFDIRKINILDYLEGARVLQEFFSVYKTKDQKYKQSKEHIEHMKKARSFMRDIIMAGVVKPKLVRKQEDDTEAILVDEVLSDWVMAQTLSAEILDYTYNKKKLMGL